MSTIDTASEEMHKWHKMIPETKIEPNQFYHIPPFMGNKARDIKVTSIINHKIWFREYKNSSVNNSSIQVMDSIEDTSIEFKLMRKHKIDTTIALLKIADR